MAEFIWPLTLSCINYDFCWNLIGLCKHKHRPEFTLHCFSRSGGHLDFEIWWYFCILWPRATRVLGSVTTELHARKLNFWFLFQLMSNSLRKDRFTPNGLGVAPPRHHHRSHHRRIFHHLPVHLIIPNTDSGSSRSHQDWSAAFTDSNVLNPKIQTLSSFCYSCSSKMSRATCNKPRINLDMASNRAILAISKQDRAPVRVLSHHIIFPASHCQWRGSKRSKTKKQTPLKKTKKPNLCQLFSDVIGWICFFVSCVDDVDLDPVQLLLVGPWRIPGFP